MPTRLNINIIIVLLIITLLTSCRQSNVEGIIIGSTLYGNQDYSTNRALCNIITRALNNDQKALIELTEFWCGGAAGCYDLGYVLTQIINKTNEKEFIKLTNELTQKQKNEILGLIAVGLEYGDNNYDGKMDNMTTREVYPALEQALLEKNNM